MVLLSLTPAFAQWSGGVKVDGAWNFDRSNSENADVRLKYSGEKFHIGTDIYFGHSFLPSTQRTSILDAKKKENEYYKGEDKATDPRKFNAGARIDFGYVFNPSNMLDASVSYGHSVTSENSVLQTERYNGSDKSLLNGEQKDTLYVKARNIASSITYSHKFESRPDANLGISISSRARLNEDVNRRITSGDFYSKQKNYVTYGSLNEFSTRFSADYGDVFRLGNNDLKLKGGLDCTFNQDLDGYSAETYAGGQWRDSTEYRQSYFYDSETIEPYVNLTYTAGKFDFFIKERVQIYWHTMLDKLEDKKSPEDLKGLFDKSDVRNLLSAGITYRVNDRNRLTLDYGRSISRPDYKKLCPTLMIGKSEGEYFMGNPDLAPEISDKVNLAYTYTKGIFVTRLDINCRDKRNTAEKVIDIERSKDITNPGVKTLYTWINNKRQDSFGTKLDFKMNGKDVRAELWAGFNYDIYWKSDKVDKRDFNYELGTSIDVFLNETTRLTSSLAYISAKQSAYNLKGEDVVANLRFSKTLVKGLELYAEFRDIVDKEVYEETWNADMNYLKEVTTMPMQRALLLGINYVF